MCRQIYILRLSFAVRLGVMIRARVDLGSQEEPPQLCCQPASLSCQTSCPAPRAGGHPRLRLRCEEQTPGPMSHVSLPRTQGPVCGKGQEVIWVQAETPPSQGQGSHVFISFVWLQSTSKPNEHSAPRMALGAAPVPVQPSPVPSCALQAILPPFSTTPCPSWGD